MMKRISTAHIGCTIRQHKNKLLVVAAFGSRADLLDAETER